jgi:hypothetical protein
LLFFESNQFICTNYCDCIFTQLYAHLTEVPSGDSEYAQFMKEAQRMYEKSLESLPGPEPPDEYKGITTKNKNVYMEFYSVYYYHHRLYILLKFYSEITQKF